jgi:D-amino peptidase
MLTKPPGHSSMGAIMIKAALTTTTLAALFACRPSSEPPSESPAEPWTLEQIRPDSAGQLRVLIIHDMEGLSGQDDPRSFDFGTGQYPGGQEMLAADVNAVVAGLLQGGATEVLIADGHGSGNPEPDLRADLLDPRARQIIRDEPFDTYFDLPESEDIDAVAVVGMHAKTGSGGFASHTFTLGIDLLINGRPITETELVALSWGRVGVPVIFASGDDRLARDLETMPWIEFVTVKEATAADSARLRPPDEAHADLTASARRAVEGLASARVMKVGVPIRASLRVVPPADLSFLEGIPGIDYADDVLSFETGDLREAYDGLVAAVGLATRGYANVLREVIRARPDGGAIMADYGDALTRRWFDQESGRLEGAQPAAAAGSSPRRFHGYR